MVRFPDPLWLWGDYVELTLVNPATSTMMHTIDFHAATGALGGAALTQVNPGEQVVLRWKAMRAGVFIYHCAPGGSMIPLHVVSGMGGAVMVTIATEISKLLIMTSEVAVANAIKKSSANRSRA
jgi:FtsP/CotA-like multicopper oxidase with cupredoxin domain